MKRWAMLLALAGALALLAPPVLAQDQPDAAKVALARQIVELSGGQEQVKAQMKMIFEAVKSSIARALPPEQGRMADLVYTDVEQELEQATPQLLDISVRTYAENYTDKELHDLIAFQMSDSGRSIAQKAPLVRAQALREMMPLMMSLLPQIMARTADRVCEELHCDARQRATIAEALSKAIQRPAS